MIEEKTWKVISYCEIPEEIREENSSLEEAKCDSYIEYSVTSKESQKNYADNFDLDNWIIDNYPELEGEEILISIDY